MRQKIDQFPLHGGTPHVAVDVTYDGETQKLVVNSEHVSAVEDYFHEKMCGEMKLPYTVTFYAIAPQPLADPKVKLTIKPKPWRIEGEFTC